ncbi:SinI family restriction endonuclease [Acinetobacter guillouiae]|uniref:SinI family restriction endonuclease n=1 Tax=Acinetobacter guillouiae TaxID=106649 RepID=UPI003AF4B320
MFDYQNIDSLDYLFDCYFHNQDKKEIERKFLTIVELLEEVPKLSSLDKKEFTKSEHYEKAWNSYRQGLVKNYSSVDASFIFDKTFKSVLNRYVTSQLSDEKFHEAATLHKIFMGVENKFGEILEEYVGSTLENDGWIWCAGGFVNGIDLIKKNINGWTLLQIKSRSNTENSSSKKIRELIKNRTDMDITSWYRLNVNPKKGEDAIEWGKLENLVNFQGFSDSALISFFDEKYQKSKKIDNEIRPLVSDLFCMKSSLTSVEKDIERVSKNIVDRKNKTLRSLAQAKWKSTLFRNGLSNIKDIDSLLEALNNRKIKLIEDMNSLDQQIKSLL